MTEITKWDDPVLALDRNILRGIYAMGFETPSPIQKQAILPIVQGHDILAQAQSGTGKTGAFSIGTMVRCNAEIDTPQAIILAPTRELAHQIQQVFSSLCIQTKLRTHLLVGGTSVDRDIHDIQTTKPHVFVGCNCT
jgi:translation initiation factor 4A